MFARLAKSGVVFGLAKFRLIEPRRIAPRPQPAGLPSHCNDNLPGVRRTASASKRRAPTPALACHWVNRDGRLECRWQAETGGDAPSDGLGEGDALDRVSGPTRGGTLIHQTVFELSYRERRRRKSQRCVSPGAEAKEQQVHSTSCVARTSLHAAI